MWNYLRKSDTSDLLTKTGLIIKKFPSKNWCLRNKSSFGKWIWFTSGIFLCKCWEFFQELTLLWDWWLWTYLRFVSLETDSWIKELQRRHFIFLVIRKYKITVIRVLLTCLVIFKNTKKVYFFIKFFEKNISKLTKIFTYFIWRSITTQHNTVPTDQWRIFT